MVQAIDKGVLEAIAGRDAAVAELRCSIGNCAAAAVVPAPCIGEVMSHAVESLPGKGCDLKRQSRPAQWSQDTSLCGGV